MKIGLMRVMRGFIHWKAIPVGVIVTRVSFSDYRSSIKRIYTMICKLKSYEVELPLGDVLYPFQDSYTINLTRHEARYH